MVHFKIRKRFSKLGQTLIERVLPTHRDGVEVEESRTFNNMLMNHSTKPEDMVGRLLLTQARCCSSGIKR